MVRTKQPLICFHQQSLTNGGASLLGYHVCQSRCVESEPSPPESDGVGRHQDDLAAVRLEGGDCVHKRFDPFQGELALRARDRAGSQLNDYSFCVTQEAISALVALM